MSAQPVVLRAASGSTVGVGHLARCRSIAQELQRRGQEYRLVVDEGAGVDWLEERGVSAELAGENLPEAGAVWLDGFRPWERELQHYCQQGTRTLLVENREADRERASGVVYPAIHWNPDDWDQQNPERCWGGPDWVPLSREVLETQREAIQVDLLITFGGCDPAHLTERALASLTRLGFAGRVACVIGPHMQERRAVIEDRGARLQLTVVDGRGGIASWMARSKLALTALGTTLYELAWFGVPGIILANYDKDREPMQWYERHGLHRGIGVASRLSEDELDQELGLALEGSWYAPRLQVSGNGTQRIADHLMGVHAHA